MLRLPRLLPPPAAIARAALIVALAWPTASGAATFNVTNTLDSGAGSLRAAIAAANAAAGADVVDARFVSGSIVLASEIEITSAITVIGPGADQLGVESPPDREALQILNPADAVVISGLSFLKSSGPLVVTLRGSVYKSATGSTRFDACVFSASRTQASGGAIRNDAGNLTLDGCSFIANTADFTGGAVAFTGGALVARNCTFDGNRATGDGGAVHVEQGSVSLVCCTMAENQAEDGGALALRNASGQMVGTLIATNTATTGLDVHVDAGGGSAALVSQGHNLIGTPIASAGGASVTTLPSDLIGAPGAPIDPLLDALSFIGGTMVTRGLLPGSPALGAGDCAGLTVDQRGVARPQAGACDVGAVEMRFPVADAGAAAATCAGSPVTLGGSPTGSGGESGTFEYSWSPATGLDDPAAANPTATLLAPTTYTVTVTDVGSGLSSQDAVDVTLLPASFTVSASAGPGGTVSPSGAVPVACDGDVTIDIVADPCHVVADVLVDGVSVGAVASHTFSGVRANHTLAATFALRTYVITASAGPGGAISPAGAVPVNCGADQAFTITPAAHYHVADVVVDGSSIGAVASHTFTNVQAAHTIAASFALDTYALTVQTSGNGSVARVPDLAVYPHGSQVELTATPDPGWTFVGWSGGAAGAANPVVVTMTGPLTVTATFAPVGYALTVTPDGDGSVTRDPDLASYPPGSTVQLTAAAAPGSRFVEWYGDASGTTNPLPLLMDGPKTVFARFLPNTLPSAVAAAAPLSGPAPLLVQLSGAASGDADGDSLTYQWTFGNGVTGAGRLVAYEYTLPGSFPVLLTVSDPHGGTDTASVVVTVWPAFPQTAVLDNFNRADGDVQGSWVDETGQFSIANNVLACTPDGNPYGYIEWNGDVYGPDQEVFATLVALTTGGEHNLMLKTQGTSWPTGHIEVSYKPATSQVIVYTLTPPQNWVTRATIGGVTFTPGDQFGARAYGNGAVKVFRNGEEIGSASVAGWEFSSGGGRIGVSYLNSSSTRFDDFGGGDFAGPATSPVAISQVYGGGGNVYTHDFIELFNRGNRPVDLTGWSVQYAGANSAGWSVTALSGVIQPGGYYLVQQASGSGGDPLPAPDATGTTAMGANSGKVALVRNTTPLDTACPGDAWIVDFVGFGNANCAEGVAAPTASSVLAVLRKEGGCEDTQFNQADFQTGPPAPRNSASPRQQCSVWLAADPPARVALELAVPRPNPVRGRMRLEFGLPRAAAVRIEVLDLQGRRVATLADGEFGAGRHDVIWDAKAAGGPARTGVYLARLQALGESRVRKFAVTR